MRRYPVIDGHSDTVLRLFQNCSCDLDALKEKHITMDALKAGGVVLQFFSLCPRCVGTDIAMLQVSLKLMDMYHLFIKRYEDVLLHVEKYSDIENSIGCGKIASLLAIEGGEALAGEMSNLRLFYRLGVRSITLTWMYRNEIADGIMEASAGGGLSDFGREVVNEMNQLGMLIDVSHISPKGFWDVMALSVDPIAATHSNAKKLCNHPRNLDDDQILAIKKNGGIIGINFFEGFLRDEGRATMRDILRHIEYIASLVGCDCLAFGSDFDGVDRVPVDADNPSCFPGIIDQLLRMNYREEDVHNLCSGNYLRVLKRVLEKS